MSNSLLTKVTALTIALTLAGCAAAKSEVIVSTEATQKPTGVKALNQPDVNELELVSTLSSNGQLTAIAMKLDAVQSKHQSVTASDVKLVSESDTKPMTVKPTSSKNLFATVRDTQPVAVTSTPAKSSVAMVSDATVASAKSESDVATTPVSTAPAMVTLAEPKAVVNAVYANKYTQDAWKSKKMDVYYTYEGETYQEAISRWLNQADFDRVGFLLDSSEKRILNRTVEKGATQYVAISEAIKQLVGKAIAQDAELIKTETEKHDGIYEGISEMEYTDDEKKGIQSKKIRIEARLDAEKKEAIITSSVLPTVMFMVEEGNVKENYIRLAEFYKWNAKPEYYLGTNYRISFGFPIVTEQGNIKAALEKLLAPFYDLRAAIVPSVRQVYVLKEKE
jgi:hypothetical protein